MIEASVEIVEGENSSDTAREVGVGWLSKVFETGIIVPMLETSIEEVDRLDRSRIDVSLSKTAILLGKSSVASMLETIASVVIEGETTSLGIAVLTVNASVSVLSRLVEAIEEAWSTFVSVGVGNKVAGATSSEFEVMMAGSVVEASEPSKMPVLLPITCVRLSSVTDEVVSAGRATSVAVVKVSRVVLGAIVPASVGSSCVWGAEGDSK
jgi:hypothetical protein